MRERALLPILPALLLLVTGVSAGQVAQFTPCKLGEATTVEKVEGVTAMRVSIIEASGEVGASVFIPDSKLPLPAILFTHSGIQGRNGHTSLLRFAQGMARAGAASIVLDGNIQWQQVNDDNGRSPHLLSCAGQWLLRHFDLDRERLVLAGPNNHWGGGDTPHCMPGESPCWHPHAWLNFGQSSAAERVNTDRMLTPEGQFEMAQHAGAWIKLGTLKPEWFTVRTSGE